MTILRTIIHLDLDAFFVAVERLDNPDLTGLPVIVGGRPEVRGVVASASYEARRFGVHSAMPTATALRLCPQAVLVSGHRDRYVALSRAVMHLLAAYTPLLEQLSIDEACLDVTGTEAHLGPPARLARGIQDQIDRELRLSASLGVAGNKLVAKIASDLHKPHGITIVPPGQEAAFLAPLPLSRLWGAGPVTRQGLARLGCETIGDVAALAPVELKARFGAGQGESLWRASHGIDDSPVTPDREARSISREETFARDVRDAERLRRELLRMSDEVAASLRRHNLQARTVNIKLRYPDFSTYTRQATLPDATDTGPAIYAVALALFEALWDRRPVRLLGVGTANFSQLARQLRLFEQDDQRQAQLDAALDRIRTRFGEDAIQRASLLTPPDELWVSRDAGDH
ncbi:MAG TPA: DNA polymerase IV [Anaerolineae bacterium]